MSKPWEKYAAQAASAPSSKKPWEKYAAQAAVSPDDVSLPESFARGAAQGVTLGHADELTGAGESLLDLLRGKEGSLSDNYTKHRDESRNAYKAAEEANPWTSAAGNLAGGVGLTLGTLGAGSLLGGGAAAGYGAGELGSGAWSVANAAQELGAGAKIANAAKIGAGFGAITGEGNSEANNVVDLAKDTAMGGLAGGISGGVIEGGLGLAGGIKRGVGNFLSETDANAARKMAKEKGISLLTKGDLAKADENLNTQAARIGDALDKTQQGLSKDYGDILETMRGDGSLFKGGKTIAEYEKMIATLENSRDTDKQAQAKLMRQKLDEFTSELSTNKKVAGSTLPERQLIKGEDSALDKAKLDLDKTNATRIANGQAPLNLNTIESKGDLTGKDLITLQKTAQENIGAAERAVPLTEEQAVLNKAGNPTGKTRDVPALGEEGKPTYALNEDVDLSANTKNINNTNTIENVPGVQAGYAPQVKGELTTYPERVKPVDFNNMTLDELLDLKSTMNKLKGKMSNPNPAIQDDAANASGRVAGDLQDLVKNNKAFDDVNKRYKGLYQAADNLGLNPEIQSNFTEDAKTGAKILNKLSDDSITNQLGRTGRGVETRSGSNALKHVNKALEGLEVANPELHGQVAGDALEAAKIRDLAEKSSGYNFFNRATISKSLPIKAGNILGFTEKAVANNTPQFLKTIAQKLVYSGEPGAMGLAQKIGAGLNKDDTGRNALMFSLMQNPTYRAMIQKHSDENSDKKK